MAVSQPHFEQEHEHSEPTVELLPSLDDPELEEVDEEEPRNARLSQEEQLVSFIVFPGSRLSPIANNPRPTLRRLFADLSNTSNVGTMIDIMASGTSFARLNDAAELIYVMDGEATISLEQKEYAVKKGAGVYLGPQETATITAPAGSRAKLFHLVVPQIPR